MRCLWTIFLVAVLVVDWLDCSPSSKDPGTRRRKNKLRSEGSSTTPTQTLELHDLLNASTTPTTTASARSSSQEKPEVSKNEKTEPHPIEVMNVESKIEVIQFNNSITKVEDNDDDRRLADLNRGTLTSNSSSSSQGRPSESDKKETKGRETITLSSPLLTTSSSLSSDNIIATRRNDSAITTYTRTTSTTPTVLTSTLPSKANVPGNLTGFTQRCPSEQAGGDCVSSTVASSSSPSSSSSAASASASASGGRATIADAAAPNSHRASSSSSSQTPSGLTQHPASSSWGGPAAAVAGVFAVGGPSVQARTAACSPCDVRQCQPVFPESCDGLIRKDVCGCCPICSSYEDAGTGMEMMVTTSVGIAGGGGNAGANVCDSIRCPRGRVCLLNIQGLPMCRCPSVFHCRRLPDRPICSTDGRTFKNRCFIGVEECVSSRTLGIAHDGRCGDEVMGMMMVVTTPASASSAIRSNPHQTQFLMSDERVRHQGYRVRNNRQRQHRRQKQTRGGEHERQPQHTDGAAAAEGDKRRPDAPQAKRKSSQGQRD